MPNDQDSSDDSSELNLHRLTLNHTKLYDATLSPPLRAHPQISSEVQARLLAFQHKRTKQISLEATEDDSLNKPLPPTPRNHTLSDPGSDLDHLGALSPSESGIPLNSNNSTRNGLAISPMVTVPLLLGGAYSTPQPVHQQQMQQSLFDLSKKPSLSQRRGMKLNMNMNDITTSPNSGLGTPNRLSPSTGDNKLNLNGELSRRLSERKKKPNFKLNLNDTPTSRDPSTPSNSASLSSSSSSLSTITPEKSDKKPQLQGLFANYSKYVDIKSGSLNFAGKASLHSKGVDFLSGSLFRISIDELEFIEELGHGNYGTVLKVLHKPTGVLMAMKEVRLELDETKFMQILMELDILHKCDSPFIVDFYGAFFVEGAVYMCMEYMNGGSLDNIYEPDRGIKDEACLAFITESVIRGLKELKDEHNIIHRDVKPTNILVNTAGKVKLCDFGVSGNLVASLARTNIGCQSYMAPERIKSMTPDDATYSVQSDIWSLGLTILEIASGHYPYPAETYDNIFSQLSAIVDGDPPKLDRKIYSKEAQSFVKSCLNKNADLRPGYATLLKHPWLQKYRDVDPHMDAYVTERVKALEEEKSKKSLSRSNSINNSSSNNNNNKSNNSNINRSAPRNSDNVHALLKNKVKAPALHRGGLLHSNRNFKRN